jgi:tripartite-type tricarboxylate transporter receptor subunit TctC
MIQRRRILEGCSLGLFTSSVPGFVAHAQTVDKPFLVLVGFPAGGTADFMARSLAEEMRGKYASTVIVDNKPGAMGTPVMNALMGREADGSACLLAPHSQCTLWPYVQRKLSYDPLRDLLPVSMVAISEFAFAVGPKVPVNNLADFVRWCRASPGNVAFGTTGHGGTPHFLGLLLMQATGLTMIPVPFRGAPQGIQQLLAGELHAWMGPLADIAQHHHSGKVRVIATSAAERSKFLQEVPSFVEQGHPTVVSQERFGVFVRSGTPTANITALNKIVVDALKNTNLRASLERLCYAPTGSSPEEFDAIIRREHERWGRVVKAVGFTPGE